MTVDSCFIPREWLPAKETNWRWPLEVTLMSKIHTTLQNQHKCYTVGYVCYGITKFAKFAGHILNKSGQIVNTCNFDQRHPSPDTFKVQTNISTSNTKSQICLVWTVLNAVFISSPPPLRDGHKICRFVCSHNSNLPLVLFWNTPNLLCTMPYCNSKKSTSVAHTHGNGDVH